MKQVLDSIDSHFHVVGNPDVFPLDGRRSYTPTQAPLERWREILGPLGVTRGVVVQPSFYGTDNRALLAALAQGEGCLRGVAAVDANVTDDELERLGRAGVRGVRLAHFAGSEPRGLGGFVGFAAFSSLAPRLRERGMHVQLITDSRLLPGIEREIGRFGVEVVIDHMGRTPVQLGFEHAGVTWLRRFLEDGRGWVKLSGMANLSALPFGYEDMRPLYELLVAANPERVVWGSDWPHTRASSAEVDTAQLLKSCLEWTGDRQTLERVMRDNAQRLYSFH